MPRDRTPSDVVVFDRGAITQAPARAIAHVEFFLGLGPKVPHAGDTVHFHGTNMTVEYEVLADPISGLVPLRRVGVRRA